MLRKLGLRLRATQIAARGPFRTYSENPIPKNGRKESSGVPDPSSELHGFDPLKPRKPLSRVALTGKQQVVSSSNNPTARSVWLGAVVLVIGAGGLMWFFRREKRRLEVRRAEKEHQGVGTPRIGGPFELRDQNGHLFTQDNLLGKFSILYFGFTLCPDVCPEELEILSYALKNLSPEERAKVQPLFVTCDPARDTPEVLAEYLSDFDPQILGLTGTYDQIKHICKQYRVYFSTPPNVKPGDKYLVDHSIFFYIMDPEGKFIDVMGRNFTGPETLEKLREHLASWRPSNEDNRSFIQKLFG